MNRSYYPIRIQLMVVLITFEFYEGLGANAKYILTAEKYIKELFY